MTQSPAPRSYWIVSTILALWMLLGVLAFTMDILSTPESRAQYLDAVQQQLMSARPTWYMAIYGLATIVGFIGTVGLLVRKAWSAPLLIVSVVLAAFQFAHSFFAQDAIRLLGFARAVPFPVFVVALGVFAVWWARRAATKGWLGA